MKSAWDSGSQTELVVNGDQRKLAATVELTIYRTVQEGLTNVRKHAYASRAFVSLTYAPASVSLVIQDNGKGAVLDAQHLKTGNNSFGLFGLRERVHLLGGKMEIQTAPGRGFCLEITLPAPDDT